jgi:peptide deformylase
MAVREVLQFGAPILRDVSDDVDEVTSSAVLKTMEDLKDTLHALQRIHGRGGGLAAPQIGSSIRLVYVNARGRSFFLLNPAIVEQSDDLFDVWDFCFSANASFVARVKRHRRIVVEYRDETGASQREEFEDYFAELLQHEIDHLDGRLFIDLIDRPETITMMEEFDRFRFNAKYVE